ncbi:MAG: LysR family transcriptional regulator [Caulobacteraceae bacterium]
MAEFDWNALKSFLAVARTGRLTAAAARLGADHTTVGRKIEALERSLGAKLFWRGPGGYALTGQGERLVATAEAMESVALKAGGEVGEDSSSVGGAVRIGTPEGFGSYFLAPRMAALAERHPKLEVQLVAMPAILSLSKREADLAITLNCPPKGRLKARKLTDYRLRLYGVPAYLDARAPIAGRADLAGHRFIGYIEDLLYTEELDYLEVLGAAARVGLKSSNLIAQLQATLAGAGLCILPDFIGAAEPGLVPVLGDSVTLTRSFWLVTHPDLAGLARVRAVADFVAEAVKAARGLFLGPESPPRTRQPPRSTPPPPA